MIILEYIKHSEYILFWKASHLKCLYVGTILCNITGHFITDVTKFGKMGVLLFSFARIPTRSCNDLPLFLSLWQSYNADNSLVVCVY